MDLPSSSSEKTARQNNKQLLQWQNRLLPWMIAMPTLLIGAFILIGTIKLNNFEKFAYRHDLDEKRISELATYQYPAEKMEAFTIRQDFQQLADPKEAKKYPETEMEFC